MTGHGLNDVDRCMKLLSRDTRLTVWHIALMMALVVIACREKNSTISVSRKMLMEMVHINSIVTYHKLIGQLTELGYISYQPSYHPRKGSLVTICGRLIPTAKA